MENKQIFSIVAIVGALLLVISAFLTWVDFEVLETISFNGLDMVTGDDSDAFTTEYTDSYQKCAGIVALAMGILAIVVEAVALLKPAFSKYGAIAALIFGLIALIYSALFFTWNIFSDSILGKLFSYQYGAYVAVIGAVVLLIMAALQTYSSAKKVAAA